MASSHFSRGATNLARIGATLAALGQSSRVFAQDVLPSRGRLPALSRFGTVQESLTTIFNLVFTIAGAIFVILLLVGGVQYLTAAGNEENTAKARRLIVDAIIGLIIVLAAFAVGRFILDRFGLSGQL